jgi:hypothetical protein
MSVINSCMYLVNAHTEMLAKLQERKLENGTATDRNIHRLISIPASTIGSGIRGVVATASRVLQLAFSTINLAVSTVATLCTLGCHDDSRKYFISSLKGVALSIVQVVKKPFDILAQIFLGVIGVGSPEKAQQFFGAICRFDASLDALCADPNAVKEINVMLALKEKWTKSEAFQRLVEKKSLGLAFSDNQSFESWKSENPAVVRDVKGRFATESEEAC